MSNPIKGKCKTGCSYCYAEKIRKRFHLPEEITFHPEELEKIRRRKKPSIIFIGTMHDIFGEWIPDEWIRQIIGTTMNCPQHTFLFCTKNPDRYANWNFPGNCYLGITITNSKDINCHHQILKFLEIQGDNTWISFEPLLEDIAKGFGVYDIPKASWYVIGGLNGEKGKTPQEWIDNLVGKLLLRSDHKSVIWEKGNPNGRKERPF